VTVKRKLEFGDRRLVVDISCMDLAKDKIAAAAVAFHGLFFN
jgi:hypothetical protein